MADTQSFNGRYALSNLITDKVPQLFSAYDAEIIPFGIESIGKGNAALKEYISTAKSNMSHSSMLVKFAPDFILLKKTQPQEIYFLEVKASATPLWTFKRMGEIRSKHPNKTIKLSDIGDIAREAWNAYNNLYPNTIILDGCSYNPKLVMAQFVDKVECLRCYKTSSEAFDCANCPVKSKTFFDIERNTNSQGSQTPHTNINYSSFERAEVFFGNLNIRLNLSVLNEIKRAIMKAGISFPPSINDYTKQSITNTLIQEGCYWLKG